MDNVQFSHFLAGSRVNTQPSTLNFYYIKSAALGVSRYEFDVGLCPSDLAKLTKDLFFFVLIRSNQEAFNWLAVDESIYNLPYVCDRDAAVKQVIGFD